MNLKIKNVLNYYINEIKKAYNDLKTKGRRYRQIPNLLTATRLIAAPLFIIPAALCKNITLLVIFATFFSLTDALDGFIAHRYNLVSDLGRDLDAICDKVFAFSLLIAASIFSPLLLFNMLLEAVIALINIREKINNREPQSVLTGKLKTWLLYPLLGIAFLNQIVNAKIAFIIFFVLALVMQILTIISYLIKYNIINKKCLSSHK